MRKFSIFRSLHRKTLGQLVILATALAMAALVSGCGSSSSSSDTVVSASTQSFANARAVFSDSVTEFNLAVFFEPNAAPYTGRLGTSTKQTWDIAKASYQELFSTHATRMVNVPYALENMAEIPAQNRSTWSQQELLSLGNSLAPALASGTTITVSVIFLSGTFEGNNGILGVQISGSHFVFVFKDVVKSVGGGTFVQRYAEQATVVHEVGHAVGLVNAGLPMYANHEDGGHPHHSSDPDDVMYWEIGSRDDVLTFVNKAIGTGKLGLFGPHSLDDGHNYHP